MKPSKEAFRERRTMLDLSRPVNLASQEFVNNDFAYFERLRESHPVSRARVSVISVYCVSRYEDCANLLKDPRLVRNRGTATGSNQRSPFPLPKSIRAVAMSMITEDDPNHRRLRELVRQAFKPQAIAALEQRIDSYSRELLTQLPRNEPFDLQANYALPIPIRLISDMMGLEPDDIDPFRTMMQTVTAGFSGLRLARTLLWDMPKAVRYVADLIERRRANLGDDILSGLIQAELDGDRLSEDELLGMVFLLVIAGFETTVHLITNGVLTLLQHPDQLDRLRASEALYDTAVEEIIRHRGPILSTKPNYTMEAITLHGVTIPKGKPVMPLFGAANHDPRAFDDPQTFDIGRTPNRHLGFGHGVHFCLGAHLARLEPALRCATFWSAPRH